MRCGGASGRGGRATEHLGQCAQAWNDATNLHAGTGDRCGADRRRGDRDSVEQPRWIGRRRHPLSGGQRRPDHACHPAPGIGFLLVLPASSSASAAARWRSSCGCWRCNARRRRWSPTPRPSIRSWPGFWRRNWSASRSRSTLSRAWSQSSRASGSRRRVLPVGRSRLPAERHDGRTAASRGGAGSGLRQLRAYSEFMGARITFTRRSP